MQRRHLLALWALWCACGGGASPPLDAGDASALTDAGIGDGGAAWSLPVPATCNTTLVPAATLECTGLYADLASKQVAAGVEPFTPAVPLWSDGADKLRWIALPPGTQIDNSNPSEWVFPVGTRLWKEFSVAGKRIETRLWQKVRSNYWVHATYAWNPTETAAPSSPGGDIPLGDGTYHIPTKDECEKCHRGRTENILGFEQVELGLPGAQGLTLAELVARGLLKTPPASTSLTIGDDGTGANAPALGWLHANCGITCHNPNPNAVAFPAGMRLRLDPTQLDGRSLAEADPRRTTVGIRVNAVNWFGETRIVPGNPGGSLLVQLISTRGTGNQMPPFATRIVDEPALALVRGWIAAMAPTIPPVDAAVPMDAAEGPDAGPADVGEVDAPVSDAGVSDAAEPEDVSPIPVDSAEMPDAEGIDSAPADPDAGLTP